MYSKALRLTFLNVSSGFIECLFVDHHSYFFLAPKGIVYQYFGILLGRHLIPLFRCALTDTILTFNFPITSLMVHTTYNIQASKYGKVRNTTPDPRDFECNERGISNAYSKLHYSHEHEGKQEQEQEQE